MFEPHTICFLSSDIPKSDVLNLIQATFLLSVVEKNHLFEPYTTYFLLSGVKKSYARFLYKLLFCCRAPKNQMFEPYTSYFLSLGLQKIIFPSPIQAAFLSSGVQKSYVRALYELLIYRRASKNHVFEHYTIYVFVVGRLEIICLILIQFIFCRRTYQNQMFEPYTSYFFCCRLLKKSFV